MSELRNLFKLFQNDVGLLAAQYAQEIAMQILTGLPVLACSEDLYAEAGRFEPCLTQVQTFYEKMFREQGYPIKYLCFTLGGKTAFPAPVDFDSDYWRSVEGDRTLFGRDTAETRRQKIHREEAPSGPTQKN